MDDAAASASVLGSGSGGPTGSGSGSGPPSAVPPGFRFHPTDEELLQYYLKKKVSSEKIDLDVIRDVDLNKLEPWELNERCRIGSALQNEWYFFSHKGKKYPTGSRTNRATAAGFWKATGRDKAIRDGFQRIGMRKTLVFYKGRAPHGFRSNWIMHEYRLDDTQNAIHHQHEDGWVVCRVFKKKNVFKGGPQDDDYEPLSNVEDNRSPGDAISEPTSDLQQFSQVNHYQTMNLSLKQNHLEPEILQYNGQESRMNQQQLNTSGSFPPQLFQNYGPVTAGHAHVHSNANPISCGTKRSSLSMMDQAAEEGIASSSSNCNNSNKRFHNQVCHGEALSSSSSSAQVIPFQLNMSTGSVAEWSATASHMNMNMMNHEQMQMRFHHQAPPPAATIAGMVDHQLTLPVRNEIDLWNFTK